MFVVENLTVMLHVLLIHSTIECCLLLIKLTSPHTVIAYFSFSYCYRIRAASSSSSSVVSVCE